MQGYGGRDAADQFANEGAIQMHPFTADIAASLPPVFQRNIITKDNADLFKDGKRGIINPHDLFVIHRRSQGQPAGQMRQHVMIGAGSDGTAFTAAPAPCCRRRAFDHVWHPSFAGDNRQPARYVLLSAYLLCHRME